MDGFASNQIKVAPRSFNQMEVDTMRGLITKKSLHADKLVEEILWYLKIPEQLKYLTPRIFDYSLNNVSPFVKMEFYGYRTLHEIFLQDKDLSPSKCNEIFQSLLFVVEGMQSYRIKCDKTQAQVAIKAMYVDKTLQRLEKLCLNDNFKEFFTQKIIVNGTAFHSLNEILTLLPIMVERLLFENLESFFSIIHGDLCFPNILMSENHKFIRLVDPRGKFGDFDVYGDYRYDLAKLLHSLEGNYDLIIADKFAVNVQGTSIDYKMPNDFEKIHGKFFEVFKNQMTNVSALRLIESTLFLSMIPLHEDSLSRQQVMLATGVKLFESVLRDVENF